MPDVGDWSSVVNRRVKCQDQTDVKLKSKLRKSKKKKEPSGRMSACWGYFRVWKHVGHLLRLCGKEKLFTVKTTGMNLHLGAGVQQENGYYCRALI